MTREEAKRLVVETVEGLQGCKATELAACRELVPLFLEIPLVILLEELVREGQLVEIEYVLPALPDRVKSFLLPKGSHVHR